MLWVWQGFWRLSIRRPVGFNGPLRIPLSEIDAYCRFNEYDYSKKNEFLFYVERLDNAFMNHIEKVRAQTANSGDATPPPPLMNRK